jgi:CBS domain containing-hemolysin-like protein
MIKKIVNHLLNALTGWIIGILTTLALSFLWLNVIPVVDRTGQGPGLPMIVLILIEMVSPVSIIGGFLGGMIPKEGGRTDQTTYAAILSAFLTTPFALFLFWYTGF